MELTSILGPVIAIGMIVAGMAAKGALNLIPQIAWNPPSVFIVIGGTFGALMVANPMADFLFGLKSVKTYLGKGGADPAELMKEILDLAAVARKESILALEKSKDTITYAPLAKAVSLAVDGTDTAIIRDTMETEAHVLFEESEVAVKFWEDFGAIAPTVGILGAVIGLMKVMTVLDQPEKIGPGIAVAFVATLYGVGFANIFGIPMGKKLKRKAQLENYCREMVLIGIEGILGGMNPRLIEQKLLVFTGDTGDSGGDGGDD